MPNYYEILQIRPDAPAPEIEVACEAQYNRWRRLVTHHDPAVVNQAGQALRFLEAARATLLDPAKRAAYDAGLGRPGTLGGLADPQARPRIGVPPPPKSPSPTPESAANVPPDAWVCPECHALNTRKMPYCPQCGAQMARACPKCGELMEKAAQFCSHCGVDVLDEEYQQQRRELRARLEMEKRHLSFLYRRLNHFILHPKTQEEGGWDLAFTEPGRSRTAKVVVLLITIAIVAGLCAAVGYAIGGALDPQGYGFGGPANGAEIGALLTGGTVGLLAGCFVASYVIYLLYIKQEIKVKIEECQSDITQLERQLQGR